MILADVPPGRVMVADVVSRGSIIGDAGRVITAVADATDVLHAQVGSLSV